MYYLFPATANVSWIAGCSMTYAVLGLPIEAVSRDYPYPSE
jgi:hypothetical protein